MEKIFIRFLITIILLGGYCFYISRASSFTQPCINFNEIYHDFGEVKKTDPLTYIFEFENTGDGILTIKKIKSDWGCLGINLSGRDYKHGEKGKIKVSFEPIYREGVQEENVYVHSNDPDFPIYKLSVLTA